MVNLPHRRPQHQPTLRLHLRSCHRPLSVPLALAGLLTLSACSTAPHKPHEPVNPITRLPPQTRPVPPPDQMPAFGSDDFNRIKDTYPDNPPDVSQVPDAEPVPEPPSKFGNKSPYTVLGETFVLLPSAKGYRATGTASFYGKKFHGLRTANGERFDMFKMSAAHRTLPLPSFVRVTNLANGKNVIVRVNDRGPFHAKRILDLSYAAAARLDMLKAGTAHVRVEAIDAEEFQAANGRRPKPADTPAATIDTAQEAPHFFVQVGAFSESANAMALQSRLTDLVYAPVAIANSGSPAVSRVHVGPFFTREDAEKVSQLIRDNDLGQPIVVTR